ncbi:hypothetical protein JYT74_00985 [Crocinitomix catalasitica]|nr:hypothetical protein [Crocinitomix catalasitica]
MKQFALIIILLPVLLPSVNSQIDSEILGSWDVNKGVIEVDTTYELDRLAAQYWDIFYDIFPHKKIDKYIISMRLITDGKDGDLGGLNQLDESLKRWELDIDTTDMNLSRIDSAHVYDYLFTLVHEFGHLMSLNIQQMKPTKDTLQNDKKGYLTTEGYARQDGYLDLFVNEFWVGKLMEDWRRTDEIYFTHEWLDSIYAFYLKYPDRFVTDYAAENPAEDLAESWACYIFMIKAPEDDWTIKNKKTNFFSDFPELVSDRRHIRTKMVIYTTRLFQGD